VTPASEPARDERTETELGAVADRFPSVFRDLGRRLDRFEQGRQGTVPYAIRVRAGAAALPYEPIGERRRRERSFRSFERELGQRFLRGDDATRSAIVKSWVAQARARARPLNGAWDS
jgi:hypothetical protein